MKQTRRRWKCDLSSNELFYPPLKIFIFTCGYRVLCSRDTETIVRFETEFVQGQRSLRTVFQDTLNDERKTSE